MQEIRIMLTGYIVGIPVTVAGTYETNDYINVAADGTAVAAADTAGHEFAGINMEEVVVASGETKTLKVLKNGVAEVPYTSVAQANNHSLVYATGPETLALTATNVDSAGRIVEVGTDLAVVDFSVNK